MIDWTNWYDDSESDDNMLPSVTDEEIEAIGDSYDDPRIDTLAHAYLELRFEMQQLRK